KSAADAQLRSLLYAAQQENRTDLRDFYLSNLALAYAVSGNTEKAVELIERKLPPRPDGRLEIHRWGALKEVALYQVRSGRPATALSVAARANSEELMDLVSHAIALKAALGG